MLNRLWNWLKAFAEWKEEKVLITEISHSLGPGFRLRFLISRGGKVRYIFVPYPSGLLVVDGIRNRLVSRWGRFRCEVPEVEMLSIHNQVEEMRKDLSER